jgi:hypothetical protein
MSISNILITVVWRACLPASLDSKDKYNSIYIETIGFPVQETKTEDIFQ